MEYIDVSGEVLLKENCDRDVVLTIIGELHGIEFSDQGHIYTCHKDNVLSIECEGTIGNGFQLSQLLARLQRQLTETSVIAVTRGQWDTTVKLSHIKSKPQLQLLPKVVQ